MKKDKSKDLTIAGISALPELNQKYKDMLTHISNTMPSINKTSSNFYKSHSQFMNVMLDVTAITPIRSIKHTLAEINKTKIALEETHLKLQENTIMIKKEKNN